MSWFTIYYLVTFVITYWCALKLPGCHTAPLALVEDLFAALVGFIIWPFVVLTTVRIWRKNRKFKL